MFTILNRHGKPQCIKVDNGRPFGDPQRQSITPLALWLAAFGIKIILNRPRTPQDNAKVERSQRVMSDWTEWQKCEDYIELQHSLWQEADFHNLHYPVSRLKGKRRIEVFPHLLASSKPFDPNDFDPQRSIDMLTSGSWEREVSTNGQFSFWGQRLSVGKAFAHQTISIKIEPKANKWLVFDKKGEQIKSFDTLINHENLWNLNICPAGQ